MTRARARAHGSDSQNLDSLLDTMANVVGILVVLLAVVQLTVGEAMDRIRVLDSVEGRALTQEERALEQQLAVLGPASLADARALERLRERLRALLADPAAARMRSDAVTATTTTAAQAAAVRRLERATGEQRRQLTALQVRVEERARDDESATVELRLPDPRPAPPAADRVVALVRYQRVLVPQLDALENQLNDAIRDWSTAGNSLRGHGARALAEHLHQLDLGNQWLRWEMIEQAGQPLARLHWRDRAAGDDLRGLQAPDAAFRRALAGLDPERHYLRFWVWGESFEAYLEARRIAESEGFAVGWQAIPTDQPLQGGLGRRVLPAAPVD